MGAAHLDIRRFFLPVLAVLATVCVIAATSPAAYAHESGPVSASPMPKAEVDQLPAQVTITFNDPLVTEGSLLTVTAPNGAVISGPTVVTDDKLSTEITDPGSQGRHTLTHETSSTHHTPLKSDYLFPDPTGTQFDPAMEAMARTTAAAPTPASEGDSHSSAAIAALVLGAFCVLSGAVAVLRRRH